MLGHVWSSTLIFPSSYPPCAPFKMKFYRLNIVNAHFYQYHGKKPNVQNICILINIKNQKMIIPERWQIEMVLSRKFSFRKLILVEKKFFRIFVNISCYLQICYCGLYKLHLWVHTGLGSWDSRPWVRSGTISRTWTRSGIWFSSNLTIKVISHRSRRTSDRDLSSKKYLMLR